MITNSEEILNYYPEEYRELLKKQILAINDTIEKNRECYTYSLDFRKAMDIIISEILSGKYLGIPPSKMQ